MSRYGLLSLLLFFSSIVQAYTLEDFMSFNRVGQVVVSPDDRQIAFTIFHAVKTGTGWQWQTGLYWRNQNGQVLQLTQNREINSLRWSPDNKQIAYLAKGARFKSIWLANPNAHSQKKLYEFNSDIFTFKWSPNGKYIAFTAADPPPKPTNLVPVDVSKNVWNTRLFLLDVQTSIIKPLTPSNISVTPFFTHAGFDWGPDSNLIVFAYQPSVGTLYSNYNKLRIFNLTDNTFKNIPYTDTHTGVEPLFSPDGKWIAFKSNLPYSKFATHLNNDIGLFGRTCVSSTSNFNTHCLARPFNGDTNLLGWNQNSEQIFVLDSYKTEGMKIYALDLKPEISAKTISNIGLMEPLTIGLNDSHHYFGFGYENVNQTPEAAISSVNPFQLQFITHFVSPPSFGKSEVIQWRSKYGMTIEGILVTPANYDNTKRYPLYIAVHGGPSGAWWQRYLGGSEEYETQFDPTTAWATLLDLGFVILQPNPRGSSGYGMFFSLANFADFGGGDYEDIMTGIDHLIRKGIADPHRLAIGGWSFGGYMTAWAISQNHRFKAAVDGDGNTDFISFSGTSDIPDYYINYLGNPFWVDSSLYIERAPIMHVKNIITPLLILEGENDVRVPPGQSYELFTALRMQNKPVKMLLLPKQGHSPTDPNVIYHSIQEINAWLSRATK